MNMDLPVCPLVVDDVRNMFAKFLTLKTVLVSKGESKALGSLLGRRQKGHSNARATAMRCQFSKVT